MIILWLESNDLTSTCENIFVIMSVKLRLKDIHVYIQNRGHYTDMTVKETNVGVLY